ncbi:hypothetical protein [Aristophania vespae]|uniref:hypothetical protein n=1 Tax=Aristophania vespae TaxID=2697033 RepID=UPI0023519AD2|nr:hypothetical protein [Aristophania vespae]
MSYSVISSGLSSLERYSSQFYGAPAEFLTHILVFYYKKPYLYFLTKREVLGGRFSGSVTSLFCFFRKKETTPRSSCSTHSCKWAGHFAERAFQAVFTCLIRAWRESYEIANFYKISKPFTVYEREKMMKGIL